MWVDQQSEVTPRWVHLRQRRQLHPLAFVRVPVLEQRLLSAAPDVPDGVDLRQRLTEGQTRLHGRHTRDHITQPVNRVSEVFNLSPVSPLPLLGLLQCRRQESEMVGRRDTLMLAKSILSQLLLATITTVPAWESSVAAPPEVLREIHKVPLPLAAAADHLNAVDDAPYQAGRPLQAVGCDVGLTDRAGIVPLQPCTDALLAEQVLVATA
mmetsp:Transcript_15972/g.45506  ORF Transcript_15972/g.45506 Transcript_15972/m.45506 type:complete len:210 (-) Transcript_15972:217-846(-)